ncbi:MAG: methyltransferase [Acidimicrobiia bacterium]|nr:methyltransferase [Acidimicrobiia bacterium]
MSDIGGLFPEGYDIEERWLDIGGLSVRLGVVRDPNRLAMETAAADFAEDERLPYWAELWPSATALGRILEKRGRLDGTRAIELGCGMGLTGVVAAMLGADVLFTDFESDALQFAAANHELNLGSPGRTRLVDWRHPPGDLAAPLILGADVVYEQRFVEPFIDTLRTCVEPGGKAFIAEPDRKIASGVLEGLESTGFERVLHMDEVPVGDAVYPVWIHELTAPDRGVLAF